MVRSAEGFLRLLWRGLALLASFAVIACAAPAATPPTVAPPPAATAAPSSAPPAPALPAVPDRLIVSYSELVPNSLPLWIAQDAGIFERHGLATELQLIESATGIPALLAGEVNIAHLGGSNVLGAAVGGADLLIVATLAPVYPYVFQAHPSIHTIDDLRGQKVGVSRFGASSDAATRVGLRKVGLDPDRDVTIIQVGSAATRTAAMLSGAVQGGVSQPPDTVLLEAQGFVTLFDLSALDLPSSQLAVAVQRGFAGAQRPILQRYVDAVIEAGTLQRQDRAFAIEVLKKYLRVDDEAALGVAYEYYTTRVLPRLPYPHPEQLADALEQLAEKNERARDYDVAALLDPSFVQSAADRGLGRE